MPVIELENIRRSYQMGSQQVHALREVSLQIREGEYVAVVGSSGSGKSTLLHILGCLDRPSDGSYRFDGSETSDLSEGELSSLRQHSIGFVFQFFHLLGRLSALGNVELPMVFAGIAREKRRSRAREALISVGLSKRLHHRPDQLSGGERQRVAIARAIIMDPRVILADEPTGNLDRKSAEEVMQLLEEMNQGALTLIVVTHDTAIAARAGRVIRLDDGRINPEGSSG